MGLLGPLRLFINSLWFFTYSFVMVFIMLPKPRSAYNCYMYLQHIAPFGRWLLGIDLETKDIEKLKSVHPGPKIFVANHQSSIDLYTQGPYYPPKTVAIGKKSLVFIPFFGLLFLLTGQILIDRRNRKRAVESMNQAKRKMKSQDLSIVIYPEGTRRIKLGPFKKGAFRLAIETGYPIQPFVASSYSNLEFNKFKSGTVIVKALDPIETKNLTIADLHTLTQQTRQKMEKAIEELNEEIRNRSLV